MYNDCTPTQSSNPAPPKFIQSWLTTHVEGGRKEAAVGGAKAAVGGAKAAVDGAPPWLLHLLLHLLH